MTEPTEEAVLSVVLNLWVTAPAMGPSLERTDSPSLRRHYFPAAPHLGVGLCFTLAHQLVLSCVGLHQAAMLSIFCGSSSPVI